MRAVVALVVCGCGRLGFGTELPADAPFASPQPLANVSSSAREFGASVSRDERELYFVSNRSTEYLAYVATRASTTDDFTAAQSAVFGGAMIDGEPALARGGLDMYFGGPVFGVAHRADAAAPWSAAAADPKFASFGGFDFGGHDLRLVMHGADDDQLYEATRPDLASAWSTPVLLAELVGSMPHQNYPTMTDDGLEILFQAYDDVAGDPGTILRSRRPALDQPFGPAEPALADVPAGVSIGDPGVSADGRTLYYGSDEGAPPGTSDLWVATLAPLP